MPTRLQCEYGNYTIAYLSSHRQQWVAGGAREPFTFSAPDSNALSLEKIAERINTRPDERGSYRRRCCADTSGPFQWQLIVGIAPWLVLMVLRLSAKDAVNHLFTLVVDLIKARPDPISRSRLT
jgi:hypothetical protein